MFETQPEKHSLSELPSNLDSKGEEAMDNMESHESGGILKILSNPWVGIAGTVASIAGFLLAFYFYYMSKETVDITYLIHPIKTILIKGGQTSRIQATFDGRGIEGDISSVQVVIWNRGDRSVRNNNILSPIKVGVTNGRILEARIIRSTRDVVGVTAAQDANGDVKVMWNILEKNDGFIMQLIYAGEVGLPINVTGIVEGQKSISEVKQEFIQLEQIPLRRLTFYLNISYVVLFIFYASAFILLIFAKPSRDQKAIRLQRQRKMTVIILTFFLILMNIYLWSSYFNSEPPFSI